MTDEEVRALVEQLDHTQFAKRDAASKKLAAGDAKVAAALAAAIQDDKPEVNYRIIAILSAMRLGDDEAVAKAARAELVKLVKSDRKAVAAQARATFYPRPQDGEEALFGQAEMFGGMRKIEMGGPGGGITVAGGVVKIFGRSQIVRSRMQDGEQLVVVHQGIGRMIVLRIGEGGIDIQVSEKSAEGEIVETEYQAIDAAELEKKHPAGYKIYRDFEKYKGGTVLNGMPAE